MFYFDLEDYEKIKNYCWYVETGGGRVQANRGGRKDHVVIKLHRLVLNFPNLTKVIDHINKNMRDNRKENLRLCTRTENLRNSNLREDSVSGVTGVNWDKNRNKWHPQICYKRKNIFLGRYENLTDAVVARLRAEKKYFKEFAPQKHLFQEYGI
jgi:hypothetical protein